MDPILAFLSLLPESNDKMEVDITLLVGGFLVSGFVISAAKYFKHHAVPAGILEGIENVRESDPDFVKLFEESKVNYIHLRDAKYYLPDAKPVPGNMNVFVRIPIDVINGFSFGKLESN